MNDGIVLPVPPARVDRYGTYKGREMMLGMRPEHLFDYHEGNQRPGCGRIERCRWTWWSRWAWKPWSTSSSTARRSARAVDPATQAAPGEMLPLTADMNHMHLMEASSGRVV